MIALIEESSVDVAPGKFFTGAMKTLVTGSAGHLGEALMRTLRGREREAVGLDVLAVAVHHACRLDRRPRFRETLHGAASTP